MKQFSFWTAGYYSFFSRRFFADVTSRWGAETFVYLLFLLAVLWIPFMFTARSAWVTFLDEDAPSLVQQIPPITIDNGRVTADVEQPHFIRNSEDGEILAIVDTTGEFTSLEGTSARLLLTDSQLFVSKSNAETRLYDLSSVQDFYLDGPKVENWLRLLGTWGLVLLYPAAVLGSYVYRLLQALFYSIFGMMIAKALKRSLNYGSLLRVTVVAGIPAIILKTALQLLDVSFSFSWLFYFLISVGYLSFGISSTSPRSTSEEENASGASPA
jgi:hypothetical protein